MISWHDESCYRPDVCLIDSNPFCMSCGSLASPDDLDAGQAPPPPVLPLTALAQLSLSWPSSVDFLDTCVGENGEDITSLVAKVLTGSQNSEDGDVEMEAADDGDGNSSDGTVGGETLEPRRQTSLVSFSGNDAIRVLRLGKGRGSDPLHGTLEVHELKYFPEYEAVSYTWADVTGDASRTKKLYLGRDWGILPITSNCEAALRCLRLPTKDRLLWIDSVCINQDDVRERSHQVQMMSIIYQTAVRVLVYLGHEGTGSDLLTSYLRDGFHEWEEKWEGMDRTLKRPYFFRSWIIQEIGVAKTVLVSDGDNWHVWPILAIHEGGDAHAQTFLPWIRHFTGQRYKTPDDLVHLIVDSWSSQATDPRDKIFALLGVISGAAADGLTADYSLSTEQVYTGFAAFALQAFNIEELLRYAGGYETSKSKSLPSWVPDWQALSQDWSIMARIQDFFSEETSTNLLREHKISSDRSERVTSPWPGAATPPRDIGVHYRTGALCLSGVKLAELRQQRPPLHEHKYAVFAEDGTFIITPPAAKEGDLVFFITGASSTVVLRPTQTYGNNNIFRFIGVCHFRIQTGVTITQDRLSAFQSAINEYAVTQMPDHWAVASLSSEAMTMDILQAQWSVRGRMAILVEDMTPYQTELFERLGREAEGTWTNIIQYSAPALLLTPMKGHSDLMEPVVHLLEELREAIQPILDMWLKVVGQLSGLQKSHEQALESSLWHQIRTHHAELEKRYTRLNALYISKTGAPAPTAKLVDTTPREELAGFISGDVKSVLRKYHRSVEREGLSPNRPCPAWYRHISYKNGETWWYLVLKTQTNKAAHRLRDGLGVSGLDAEAAAKVLEENLEEAKGWQKIFSDAIEEVELVSKSVTILMKQRKRYRDLTKDGWKRIVII